MDEKLRMQKMIDELGGFIRKVLSDPTIAVKSMEIARQFQHLPDAEDKIAREISATTNLRIPEHLSDADRLFLKAIRDVLDDEAAFY